MTWPLTVVVRYDIGRLSPNLRIHFMERASRVRALKGHARYAWGQAGSPATDAKVIADIIVRRARKMDADNALSACKAAIDGLFKARQHGYGITPDDSPEYLELGTVTQITGTQWKGREEVCFIVRPVEG